ncbi:methyl-accepting chemotaxis protein [Teredinibacter purpureus]|uniref:methyl-accepting chemotaxis protein n=1 Tax=Teredinibacter purpureus TaxID=2731756 RepID=UPI0005F82A4A|nr:methyl-accepting chemotaxis protein [Teredinibacter purpureus]
MNNWLSIFGLGQSQECKDMAGKLAAVSRTQAIIEFDPSGRILEANSNFLTVTGYTSDEVVGRHHRMFVDDDYANSQEYMLFWENLARGESVVREFKRVGKGGKEIWIQGSYNPLRDDKGKVYKVIKFAIDVTARKQEENTNRIAANQASALKLCSANVMLADNDLNIVYVNDTVVEMLTRNEAKIKESLPSFAVGSLIGTSVDGFHNDASHQRKLLGGLTDTYSTNINVSGLTFGLIATPWFDAEGTRLGTLVEWEDKTERLAEETARATKAAENLRIRQALDVCDTSVMLADKEMNIIYMNEAVRKMMSDRETTIRQQLPNFSVSRLIGTCVDDFHVKPSHQRQLLNDLRSPYSTNLDIAGLTFGLIATPLFSPGGERLGTVVEWDDKTERLAREAEEKAKSDENARVRQALDNVTTNVMIADPDANIIYLNDASVGMMSNAQADIRKALPTFDASKLKGANMDIFHKDVSHQRGIINNLTTTYFGNAEVGGRTFTVIANPIIVDGERLGTVVEWADRTAEVAIEREIDSMVESASAGDFSKQISLDGKTDFFANLGKGLNDLISTVEVALNDVIRMLGAMARGDLSERITRDYRGAFGTMKIDANATADKLTDVITKIRTASGSITSAANEIAQGNADLSQRTEEQASSLEETASSMEQMTSTVKQSADNAIQASSLAMEAQTKAQSGGDVVNRAVVSMGEINTSSKKISDIIGVIDEIAFQTNLLALNAAVEAARAGEQGRGFAVVAGEVRNLAQRSAGAAKEIKDLIRDSVSKVQDGTAQVNESGQTLADIVASVESVTAMMREIADAAKEQTSGIEQVNTAVSQMDEMTQQNAALVEEASAAGEAMADQARALNQVVDFFSIAGHREAAAANAPSTHQSRPTTHTSVAHRASVEPPMSYGSQGGATDDEWEDF